MANFVPEDLIFFQILARLPLKFLLQLTLICKRWHFLITNPGSIQFHIANASYNLHNSPSFLSNWHTETLESGFIIANKDENNVLIKRINDSIRTTCKHIFSFYEFMSEAANFFLLEPEQAVSAIGSAHGLVCFCEKIEDLYFIWNPMTKMLKTVSNPSRDLSENICYCASRVFYDPVDGYFKIIEIERDEMQSELGKVLFRVWVYSCNLDNWRQIRCDSVTLPNSRFHIVEHVKDTLYVEFQSEPEVLVAFHIRDEVFERLPCPKHTVQGAKYGTYINWKDCFGIVVDTEANDLSDPGAPFGRQNVYTFDEIRGTWIEQYSAPDFLTSYRLFFGLENGDLVVDERLWVEVGELKLFEAQSRQFRNLANVCGLDVDVMLYTESLVCINGMQQL